MEKKDGNPKDYQGITKWRTFSTIPLTVVAEVGAAFGEGASKYGRHNYRVAGATASVYIDGALGHIMQWWEGEDNDPVTTLSHLSKAIANLIIIRDSMIQGTLKDDRPPKANLDPFREQLQASVDYIIKQWPDPVEPHTEINSRSDLTEDTQTKAAKLNQIIMSAESSKSLMQTIAEIECDGESHLMSAFVPGKIGDFQKMKRYPCGGIVKGSDKPTLVGEKPAETVLQAKEHVNGGFAFCESPERLQPHETCAQVSPGATFDPSAERRKVLERALERATDALNKFGKSLNEL